MKTILIALTLGISVCASTQKLSTRSGQIRFEASMPAFEEVTAKSGAASAVLESGTGGFAALVLVKSFSFKVALMEEHFNENYMESDKFPKATLKGSILNFAKEKISATAAPYDFEGDLTIHGVTRRLKTRVMLSMESGKIRLTSAFKIRPADYGIEIPSLVKSKVSETVSITANFLLE